MKLHNCGDCAFEESGECEAMRNRDGTRKPIRTKPTDCGMFIAMPTEEDN